MLTSGQLLADRYRLGRRIAVGGMGEVWEAADTRLDRRVAVKVLKPELCGDAEFLHRFRTEARTTASLNHPGIAGVHDYGETAAVPDGPQDTAYLVMELVEGEPLSAILATHGRLTADVTLDILEQAGNALQAAHERGYVHRDVKPGNILVISSPGGALTVKLTDFGIAKAADAAPVTRRGMVMGTAHYIAPEQALGNEAEPASDVYSLAVVGYECLMGHRPFLAESAVTVAMMHIRDIPPPLPPDVPPGPRALIEATLVKDPRQRYRSGGEFAAAAAAVRAGAPLPTPSGLALAGPGSGVGLIPPVPQALPGSGPQLVQPVPPGMPPQPVPQTTTPLGMASGPVGQPPVVLPAPRPTHGGSTRPPMPPVPPPPGAGSGPFTGVGMPMAGPTRPRRRTALWIVLVAVLLVLIGVGAWALTTELTGSRNSPSGGSNQAPPDGRPLGAAAPSGVSGSGTASNGLSGSGTGTGSGADGATNGLSDGVKVDTGAEPAGTRVAVDDTIHVGEAANAAVAALARVGLYTDLETTQAQPVSDPAHCAVVSWRPPVATVGSTVTVRCDPDSETH